jgi:cell division protein FtsQ
VSGRAVTLPARLRSAPWLPSLGARARALARSQRVRRYLVLLAAALLVLAAGYHLWLRDSSFVAIERVTVTGLSTSDAERVRAALEGAGRSMTTLHVDHDALERAIAGFPVVHELEVSTDFPHGLQIHVVEHVPAAIVVADGVSVPVAGDGTVLDGLPVEGRLPTVQADGVGAERLRDPAARAAVAVAGAAPAALRRRIEEVGEDGDLGQVARLREGPDVILGDATRLGAKWAAAARVLADLEASGASYVDVRIPGRPAVGGLPAETITPVAPAGTTSTIPPGTIESAAADPAAAGAVPPVDGTVPPETTASPAGTTLAQTETAPVAPEPVAPAPQPTAPLTGGAAGGATAAPPP